jgi:ATP phosphoribosyltransferase
MRPQHVAVSALPANAGIGSTYHCAFLQVPGIEVWFQRASDCVRKLMYGDFDLIIVGYDMFSEIACGDPDLIVLHDALDFGHCHLGLGVPMGGKFLDINR